MDLTITEPTPVPPPEDIPQAPAQQVPQIVAEAGPAPYGAADSSSTSSLPAGDYSIPPHDHEMPEHDHHSYDGKLSSHDAELNRLKLAVAQLGKKLLDKDKEIYRLNSVVAESQKEREVVAKELAAVRAEREKVAHAMPVVIYDAEENKVAGVSLFATGKGEALEKLLGSLVQNWQGQGRGVEVAGLPPHMAVRVKGDASGRGFDLFPSSVLFLRLSRKEREVLGKLPPLVSAGETKEGGTS
jgi:hypothetical protein